MPPREPHARRAPGGRSRREVPTQGRRDALRLQGEHRGGPGLGAGAQGGADGGQRQRHRAGRRAPERRRGGGLRRQGVDTKARRALLRLGVKDRIMHRPNKHRTDLPVLAGAPQRPHRAAAGARRARLRDAQARLRLPARALHGLRAERPRAALQVHGLQPAAGGRPARGRRSRPREQCVLDPPPRPPNRPASPLRGPPPGTDSPPPHPACPSCAFGVRSARLTPPPGLSRGEGAGPEPDPHPRPLPRTGDGARGLPRRRAAPTLDGWRAGAPCALPKPPLGPPSA